MALGHLDGPAAALIPEQRPDAAAASRCEQAQLAFAEFPVDGYYLPLVEERQHPLRLQASQPFLLRHLSSFPCDPRIPLDVSFIVPDARGQPQYGSSPWDAEWAEYRLEGQCHLADEGD